MNPNENRPIVVTLWGPDPNALATFYSETLHLARDDQHGHTPNFRIGEMWIVLMSGEPQPPQNPSRSPWPIFAWSTSDYAAIKADLEKEEVEILEQSPAGQAHEWFMFADPAGNVLELVNAEGPPS